MYLQDLFHEQRPDVLASFIAHYPLGAIVSKCTDGIGADHVPFTVHPNEGSSGVLRCHVARGNPLWQSLNEAETMLIIFQSPNAYISPTWMPGRNLHGKVAPSWNYAAVHVYARARVINDHTWLTQHLTELTQREEANRADGWSLNEAPEDFVHSLLNYIVGIEFTIERIVGKWFVGQQRSPADREGVVAGLRAENTDAARIIADWMTAYAPPPKTKL